MIIDKVKDYLNYGIILLLLFMTLFYYVQSNNYKSDLKKSNELLLEKTLEAGKLKDKIHEQNVAIQAIKDEQVKNEAIYAEKLNRLKKKREYKDNSAKTIINTTIKPDADKCLEASKLFERIVHEK